MKRFSLALRGSSPLRHRLLRAIQWSVLGAGLAQATYLASSVLTARLLGSEDFGRLSMIQLTLNMLVSLIAPSIGWSIMRAAATMRTHERSQLAPLLNALLWIGMLGSAILSAGLFGLSQLLCIHWLEDPPSIPAFAIASVSVAVNGYFSLVTSLLSGLEAFRGTALLNTVRGILIAVMMLAGAALGGLNGAAAGFTLASGASALFAWVVLRWLLRQHMLELHAFDWARARQTLAQISFPMFLSTVTGAVTLWLGGLLLARYTQGFSQIAVFNAANHWKAAITFLPTQITQASSPILSNLWGAREIAPLKSLIRTNLRLVALTCGVPALVVSVAAPLVLGLYLIEGVQASWAFRLLILSGLMASLCSVFGYTMIAMGKAWQSFAVNFLWMVAFMLIAFVSLSSGVLGLSVSYFCSYALLLVVAAVYVRSALRGCKEV